MTAPTEEATEQDQARDETLPHYYCWGCYPGVGPGRLARAVCGTWARTKGGVGYVPDACCVCDDIWRGGFKCERCGYQNFRSTE